MSTQLILHKNTALKTNTGYHPLLKTLELSKKVSSLKLQLARNNFRSFRKLNKMNSDEITVSSKQEQDKMRVLYERITVADLQQMHRYESMIPEIESIQQTLEICEFNIRHNFAAEKTRHALNLISERLEKLLPVSN